MEKFLIGLAVGMAGGALIVANNYKARQLVRKGQTEMSEKFEQMLDDKLSRMCCDGSGQKETD